jgi:hypothetical protein
MVKYKEAFQEMLTFNKELFDEFKKIHDNYLIDPATWEQQFHSKGTEVLRIIQRFDSRLCLKSESGRYGKFSSNLSEKFWGEVRKHFPKIDFVGAK